MLENARVLLGTVCGVYAGYDRAEVFAIFGHGQGKGGRYVDEVLFDGVVDNDVACLGVFRCMRAVTPSPLWCPMFAMREKNVDDIFAFCVPVERGYGMLLPRPWDSFGGVSIMGSQPFAW